MALLTNWYFEGTPHGSIIMHGRVTGHNKLPDGTFINSSPIINYIENEDELVAFTNHTEYHLMYKSCNKFILNNLKSTIKDEDFIKRIISSVNKASSKKKRLIEKYKKNMEPETLLLFYDAIEVQVVYKNEYDSFPLVDQMRTDMPDYWFSNKADKYQEDYWYCKPENEGTEESDIESFAVLTNKCSSIALQYSLTNDRIVFTSSLNDLFDIEEIPEGKPLGILVNYSEVPLNVTFSWGKQTTIAENSAYKIYYKQDEEPFCLK